MEAATKMSRRSVSPGEGFKHFGTTVRADGRPDRFHTGGVWLTPDEKTVYKPLTAWPCANATRRVPTAEAECLAEMSGKPGFLPPDTWHTEECNGERWLVMPRIYFWPQDMDVLQHPSLEDLLAIEEAVKTMNAAGWEYNDPPQLAYYQGKPVLMDFSNSHKPTQWKRGYHGDGWRTMRWFKDMRREDIVNLRRRGNHIRRTVQLPEFCSKLDEPYDVLLVFHDMEEEKRRQHEYIYASTEWDVDPSLPAPPNTKLLLANGAKTPTVYAWIVSTRSLTDLEVEQHKLTVAWTPWP